MIKFDFLSKLENLDIMPKNILYSKVGSIHIYNVFDERRRGLIESNVQVGLSLDDDIALFKALSEYFERKAYRKTIQRNDLFSVKNGSDGFAAYPILDNYIAAESLAKENAFCEALERYVWANWWDLHGYAEISEAPLGNKFLNTILENLCSMIDVETIFTLSPSFEGYNAYKVIILMLKIRNEGFITGGAAGLKSDENQIFERASSELFRHGLAYNRYKSKEHQASTFYEKRLVAFGTGKHNDLVYERLIKTKTTVLEVPDLEVDEKIDHDYKDHYAVHRCLFKNQPAFVKGDLLRLCL